MKKLIFKKLISDINIFFFIAILSTAAVIWVVQAVNFLDIIAEDGHSFKIYFLYTIFNLPKIISKILPFVFLISLINIFVKYEINNELIIFWLLGINKIKFTNTILKISVLYFFLQLSLTSFFVPYSLDKARSFFRNSNVDLFTSIIKEKKFIDAVSNLTIFVEEKNGDMLKKIMLKDRISNNEFQIIVAEDGKILNNGLNKSLSLYNGKIINHSNKSQKIINFSEFQFDLSKYSSNTISHPKIQENSSKKLLKCFNKINYELKKNLVLQKINVLYLGCNFESKNIIKEELFKRFYSPIYIILIGLISSLVILRSKDNKKYFLINSFIFIIGVFIVILSEISLKYSSLNDQSTLLYIGTPIFIFIPIYIYLIHNSQNKS